jgi:cyclopropane-fatty-acyl-phospholipid synthase
MSIHYDLPRGRFESLLGDSMKYSMGLWEQGAERLEEAEEAMLADLCHKAKIEDGHTILDIGCGFGSFASHALRAYPKSKVYGLTLSRVQAEYIRDKQAEAGHPLNTDRFYLIQDDLNTATFPIPFDRIISIGVFEHVSNLAKGLEKVRGFLKPDGACLLHYIVYFRALFSMVGEDPLQNPFIAKHIFPGGRIWSEQELYKYPHHLRVEQDWRLNGSNYRRTLECWLRNLNRNWDKIKATTGLNDHVLKLWDFYFRGCVSVFRYHGGRYYGNAQYLLRPA